MQNQTKRRETSKIDARITRRRASRDVQKIAKKNALHVFGNLRRRLRRRVLADVRVRFAESASVSPYVSLSFFLMSSSFSLLRLRLRRAGEMMMMMMSSRSSFVI